VGCASPIPPTLLFQVHTAPHPKTIQNNRRTAVFAGCFWAGGDWEHEGQPETGWPVGSNTPQTTHNKNGKECQQICGRTSPPKIAAPTQGIVIALPLQSVSCPCEGLWKTISGKRNPCLGDLVFHMSCVTCFGQIHYQTMSKS
jgi:hypothetical protein